MRAERAGWRILKAIFDSRCASGLKAAPDSSPPHEECLGRPTAAYAAVVVAAVSRTASISSVMFTLSPTTTPPPSSGMLNVRP